MLNAMAGADFEASAKRHQDWGLRWMDLKDSIYGMAIEELTLEDARSVARVLRATPPRGVLPFHGASRR